MYGREDFQTFKLAREVLKYIRMHTKYCKYIPLGVLKTFPCCIILRYLFSFRVVVFIVRYDI